MKLGSVFSAHQRDTWDVSMAAKTVDLNRLNVLVGSRQSNSRTVGGRLDRVEKNVNVVKLQASALSRLTDSMKDQKRAECRKNKRKFQVTMMSLQSRHGQSPESCSRDIATAESAGITTLLIGCRQRRGPAPRHATSWWREMILCHCVLQSLAHATI